ncbi:MAG: hypothetical protein JXJ04_26010 [Spirochaetales bacterium]|nr:hypothetical protein [Spirochaetales bacterium]
MKIRISSAANQDLIEGYYFYENQKENLGSYFLDSLYSDIDSFAYPVLLIFFDFPTIMF